MLHEYNLPLYFWAEAVNTSCYISNRVFKRPILNKTSYELWKNRKPKISYLRVFGCKCFILNTKNNLGKFDSKADEGIFLGYSTSSKTYRVFNKRTLVVEESMHVVFNESNPLDPRKDFCSIDDDVGELINESIQKENANKPLELEDPKKEEDEEMPQPTLKYDLPKDWQFKKAHPQDLIIGDTTKGVTTRSQLNSIINLAFISQIEPKNIDDAALSDEFCVLAMQEELN